MEMRTCSRRVEAALSHPFLLGKIYMPQLFTRPWGRFHVECMELAMHAPRGVFALPRDHGKTTNHSIGFPIWKICRAEWKQVLLLASNQTMADMFFKSWRDELEGNDLLRKDMGLKVGRKWSGEGAEILVRGRKVEMLAKGSGCSSRGLHPDHIQAEDLEDEEEADSKSVRETLFTWWWRTVMGMIRPDTSLHLIGTIVHPLSLIAELTENPPPGWVTRRYPAIIDRNGKPEALWPEHRGLDWLEKKRAEMGSSSFNAEYMNDPRVMGFKLFEHKNLRYYDDAELPEEKKMFTTMTLDPSMGDQNPWAINVLSRTGPPWNQYVREYIEKLTPPAEMIRTYFQMLLKWQPAAVGVEMVAGAKLLGVIFSRDEYAKYGVPYLEPRRVGGMSNIAKEVRHRALQPAFENGRIYIKREQVCLRDSILIYPRKPDEGVDTLSMHQEISMPFWISGRQEKREEKEKPRGITFNEAVAAQRNRWDSDLHPWIRGNA